MFGNPTDIDGAKELARYQTTYDMQYNHYREAAAKWKDSRKPDDKEQAEKIAQKCKLLTKAKPKK